MGDSHSSTIPSAAFSAAQDAPIAPGTKLVFQTFRKHPVLAWLRRVWDIEKCGQGLGFEFHYFLCSQGQVGTLWLNCPKRSMLGFATMLTE